MVELPRVTAGTAPVFSWTASSNKTGGQDCSGFLREVSEISFILQENLPELEWVLRGVCPGGQMVKLRGSAPLSHATLVWTVKPVVSLPESTKTDMLADLGMSETPMCDRRLCKH